MICFNSPLPASPFPYYFPDLDDLCSHCGHWYLCTIHSQRPAHGITMLSMLYALPHVWLCIKLQWQSTHTATLWFHSSRRQCTSTLFPHHRSKWMSLPQCPEPLCYLGQVLTADKIQCTAYKHNNAFWIKQSVFIIALLCFHCCLYRLLEEKESIIFSILKLSNCYFWTEYLPAKVPALSHWSAY